MAEETMFITTDLHGHTLFSDGRATPEEYIDARRQHAIRAVAISDHDVLSAVERGAAAAARAGMIFVPAVEVTSFIHFGTEHAEQIHVLAYYPAAMAIGRRIRGAALYQRGMVVQGKWKAFVLSWMADLSPDDRSAIDAEGALESMAPSAFPALQSMIDRIVQRRRPLFESFRDHHRRFWETDRELFGWEPEEAIEAIRADGAVDIVAHPGRYRDKARIAQVLERASGLEVYTSRHRPDVAAYYRAFAKERKKLWTASSDDHQNTHYTRPPVGTPAYTLERILRAPLPIDMVVSAGA